VWFPVRETRTGAWDWEKKHSCIRGNKNRNQSMLAVIWVSVTR
jgi:hypothetical protein